MKHTHYAAGARMADTGLLPTRTSVSGFEQPGAFQCAILRALELPKAHREVLLLKDIQGHSLMEIAAILGISIETARARLKRARLEIGLMADPQAMGRGL